MSSRLMQGFAVVAVLLGGCGEVGPVDVHPVQVRMDPALRDNTNTIVLYALSPSREDDVVLTCEALIREDILVSDKKVKIFDQLSLNVADVGTTLEFASIPAGKNRIFLGEALGTNGAVVGRGCTDSITIRDGKTSDVTIFLFPI